MTVYALREPFEDHVGGAPSMLRPCGSFKIFPGLVEETFIRAAMGEEMFRRAVELGVLVKQEPQC